MQYRLTAIAIVALLVNSAELAQALDPVYQEVVAQRFWSSPGDSEPSTTALATDGTLLVAGRGPYDPDHATGFVAKVSVDGRLLWFRTFDLSEPFDVSVVVVSETIDGGAIVCDGIDQLLRFTASGDLAWRHLTREVGLCQKILRLQDGGFLIDGMPIDDGPPTFRLTKIAANGTFEWFTKHNIEDPDYRLSARCMSAMDWFERPDGSVIALIARSATRYAGIESEICVEKWEVTEEKQWLLEVSPDGTITQAVRLHLANGLSDRILGIAPLGGNQVELLRAVRGSGYMNWTVETRGADLSEIVRQRQIWRGENRRFPYRCMRNDEWPVGRLGSRYLVMSDCGGSFYFTIGLEKGIAEKPTRIVTEGGRRISPSGDMSLSADGRWLYFVPDFALTVLAIELSQ